MKNQVLTIEQVLELKKLGFNIDKYSSMLWTSCDECSCSCIDYKESPMAYKDCDLIESLIEPTVEIIHKVKPVINIKAK